MPTLSEFPFFAKAQNFLRSYFSPLQDADFNLHSEEHEPNLADPFVVLNARLQKIWDDLASLKLSTHSALLYKKLDAQLKINNINKASEKIRFKKNLDLILEMRFKLIINEADLAQDIMQQVHELITKHSTFAFRHYPDYEIYQNLCFFVLEVCALGIALFATASLIPAAGFLLPYFTPFFALSFMTLLGVSYGILNAMLACRMSLPYYLFGHIEEQRSFSISNSPNVQAVHWGVLATAVLSLGLGLIFCTAALITTVYGGHCLSALLNMSVLAMLGLILLADYMGQRHAAYFTEHKTDLFNRDIDAAIEDLDTEQIQALYYHIDHLTDLAKWHGNNSRNLVGYLGGFSIGIATIIICLTVEASSLPALFQTALFAQYVPLAVASMMFLGIAYAMNYSMRNKDLILEDAPYRLEKAGFLPTENPDHFKIIASGSRVHP